MKPDNSWDGRAKRRRLTAVAGTIAAAIFILILAYSAGWIGGSSPPKVSLMEFQAVVDGVSDCTATFNYVLYNEGTAKAYVDIDYLDNGYVIGHDLYVVEPGQHRSVGHSIEHVDCLAEHNYAARIAAVS